MERLSAATARRVALAAQGFGEQRPVGRIDRRHARRVFQHVQLVQIDSVNVLPLDPFPKFKLGHCYFQNRPLGVETGQHPFEKKNILRT